VRSNLLRRNVPSAAMQECWVPPHNHRCAVTPYMHPDAEKSMIAITALPAGDSPVGSVDEMAPPSDQPLQQLL
jgi:hypothetical protein